MAKLKIVKIGDPVLRSISRPVEKITPRTLQLLDDMVETMRAADGVGLAAPQVGVLKRAIVIDLSEEGGEGPYKLINPKIIKRKGEQICREGCLSVPGVLGDVIRPAEVTVEALNEKGEKVVIKAKDILAVVFCHEIDHLDGILYIDRISRLKRQMLIKKLNKSKK
jgi:peptide deformylase